jgi:hypothetical protein
MEIYWPVKGGRGNAVLVRGPGSGGRSPLRRVEDAVIGSAGLNPLDIDVKRVVDGDSATVTIRHLARIDTP